jgi:hypothetical protein
MTAMLVIIRVFLVSLGPKWASGREIGPGEEVDECQTLNTNRRSRQIPLTLSLRWADGKLSASIDRRPKLWLAEAILCCIMACSVLSLDVLRLGARTGASDQGLNASGPRLGSRLRPSRCRPSCRCAALSPTGRVADTGESTSTVWLWRRIFFRIFVKKSPREGVVSDYHPSVAVVSPAELRGRPLGT